MIASRYGWNTLVKAVAATDLPCMLGRGWEGHSLAYTEAQWRTTYQSCC
jgi:hypothetical protein